MIKKVLVVDDEPSIVTLLTFNLEKEGYDVTSANDGETALNLALQQSFDFILLDLMLPKLDGLEVTRQLRNHKIYTPILMITAKDESIDCIIGIEMGADDYITKPFSPREVIARMKAITRRMEQTSTPTQVQTLKNGPLTLNVTEHSATLNNHPITLTHREFDLLAYFMQHLDEAINRETLLQYIWQSEFAGESRNIDIYISHLREKIEKNPKSPQLLLTVRGVGYKMVHIHD